MEEPKDIKQKKLKQTRSIGYPLLSLADCVRIIEQAARSGRNLTNEELAAFKLTQRGKKPQKAVASISSGAFSTRRASLKDFGLIDLTKDGVYITDLSMTILTGQNEEEKTDAKKRAFLSPELFAKIYKELPKETPIKKIDNLGNKAVTEGVLLKMRENFVKSFVKSGIYAGLITEKGKDEITLLPHDIELEKTVEEIVPARLATEAKLAVLRLPFPGGIELTIPSNEAVSQALFEGKLKTLADEIKKFAEEVLNQKENER